MVYITLSTFAFSRICESYRTRPDILTLDTGIITVGMIIFAVFHTCHSLLVKHNLCFLAAMVELDGDEVRVSSRGRYAERDIVQVGHLSGQVSCRKL